jgi:hypothetical protein
MGKISYGFASFPHHSRALLYIPSGFLERRRKGWSAKVPTTMLASAAGPKSARVIMCPGGFPMSLIMDIEVVPGEWRLSGLSIVIVLSLA